MLLVANSMADETAGLIGYTATARYLNVPIGTLYSWVARGHVPHVRLGPRTVRFDVRDLNLWIEAGRLRPAVVPNS